jgi:hypothetical protein
MELERVESIGFPSNQILGQEYKVKRSRKSMEIKKVKFGKNGNVKR